MRHQPSNLAFVLVLLGVMGGLLAAKATDFPLPVPAAVERLMASPWQQVRLDVRGR